MGKIITMLMAINKPISFFRDKKAKALTTISNKNNEVIPEGTIVKITGRFPERTKFDFNIKDEETGISIYNVHCEDLELID